MKQKTPCARKKYNCYQGLPAIFFVAKFEQPTAKKYPGAMAVQQGRG